jgi:DNA-binding LytR/AlgR family response regulator
MENAIIHPMDPPSSLRVNEDPATELLTDCIFIPDNYEHVKVPLHDIIYLQADGSYIKLFTTSRFYQLSINLKKFSEQVKYPFFQRISRQHIINIQHLHRVNCVQIVLKNQLGEHIILPIAKQRRSELLSILPVLKL